ncbi:MAG: beta-lactamase family protein [Candidatus Riflebacteria bacterium]|nr:beta-lactamase family protein [Candidatus Riflebacteria bacterium]
MGARTVQVSLLLAIWVFLTGYPWAIGSAWSSLGDELKEVEGRLEEALGGPRVPGAAVAVIRLGEEPWIRCYGVLDRESPRPVTRDTLFRIGCCSKMVVGVAAMMLVDEGKLRLDDSVRRLAPEIAFENPWESTRPLRVVHLLENATGFDEFHPCEQASNDPRPLSLMEGIDLHPHSRVCRWPPGDHYFYSSSGFGIAARVMEKVAGVGFEEFVRQRIFTPLEMTAATYRLPDPQAVEFATGYLGDGKTRARYWHLWMRPIGGLNASVRGMANFVTFLLERGTFKGKRLLSPASVERLQRPHCTIASRLGQDIGYGLGQGRSTRWGVPWNGHTGGPSPHVAWVYYAPSRGVGYVVMMSADLLGNMDRITQGIRDTLVPPPVAKPAPPPTASLRAPPPDVVGFYELHAPPLEILRACSSMIQLSVVEPAAPGLVRRPFPFGLLPRRAKKPVEYTRISSRQYRSFGNNDRSLFFYSDEQGELYMTDGSSVHRRVTALRAWGKMGLWAVAVICFGLPLVMAPYWVWRCWRGSLALDRRMGGTILSLVASVSLIGVACLFFGAGFSYEGRWRFGEPTCWSVGACVLSLLFAMATLGGALCSCLQGLRAPTRLLRISAALAVLGNGLHLGHLAYHGIIGLRTWSY